MTPLGSSGAEVSRWLPACIVQFFDYARVRIHHGTHRRIHWLPECRLLAWLQSAQNNSTHIRCTHDGPARPPTPTYEHLHTGNAIEWSSTPHAERYAQYLHWHTTSEVTLPTHTTVPILTGTHSGGFFSAAYHPPFRGNQMGVQLAGTVSPRKAALVAVGGRVWILGTRSRKPSHGSSPDLASISSCS